MPDYTKWPTLKDLEDKLSATGLKLPAGTTLEYLQRQLDAVAEETERYCRRQFVPSPAPETRWFDGTGTGEIEIDEYISISSIRIVGWFGSQIGFSITHWNEVKRNRHPKTRVQIFQGSLPAFARIWIDRFPIGRNNIEVTAIWGYDAEIPADLWEAVVSEAAYRILTETVFPSSGWLKEWQEADVLESREYLDPKKYLSWNKQFRSALKKYRKPDAVYLRKLTRTMI